MTLAAPQPTPGPYVLQTGDTIGVQFYNNADLNEELVVRPDGKVSLQLIGEVVAAGLTPEALAAQLEQAYRKELATPRVTVIVRTFSGARVYVGGEVAYQRSIPMVGELTLYQAIQEAGGFLKSAHRKQVVLIRRGEDGKPHGYTVDLRPIQTGENPEQDIPLRPYDVVFVPRSKIGNVDTFVELYIKNVLVPVPIAIPAF